MAQRVNLNSILRTHRGEGGKQILQVVLEPPLPCCGIGFTPSTPRKFLTPWAISEKQCSQRTRPVFCSFLWSHVWYLLVEYNLFLLSSVLWQPQSVIELSGLHDQVWEACTEVAFSVLCIPSLHRSAKVAQTVVWRLRAGLSDLNIHEADNTRSTVQSRWWEKCHTNDKIAAFRDRHARSSTEGSEQARHTSD